MFTRPALQLCWMLYVLSHAEARYTSLSYEQNSYIPTSTLAMGPQKASMETLVNHIPSNEENIWKLPVGIPGLEDDTYSSQIPSILTHVVWTPESTLYVGTSQAGYSTSTSSPLFLTSNLIMATTVPNSESTAYMEPIVTTSSATSTTTVLATVFVGPTPTDPLEVSLPTATTSADTEATPSTTPMTKRSTILIGLSVGLIIGVLMLAGMLGLYLWRRRKNMHSNIEDSDDNSNKHEDAQPDLKRHKGFTRLFNLRRSKESEDTEWSIESAEKVSIVKNMRAQSVLTRSSSKRSNALSDSGMIPIGIPEEGMRIALTSHPMTPSYTGLAEDRDEGGKPGVKDETKLNRGTIVE